MVRWRRDGARTCLLLLPKFGWETGGDFASDEAVAHRPGEKTGDAGVCLEAFEGILAGARWLRRVDLMASSCSTISAAKNAR